MAEVITLVNMKKNGEIPKRKRCTKCKEEKDAKKDFYKKREARDGRSTMCILCEDKRAKEYQERKKAEREWYW